MPPEPTSCANWFRGSFFGSDGRPFSESEVPWITAPGGPCEAFDNPQYRTLWLQWGARLFKTNFALGCLLMTAECDPAPGMLATVDETLAKQVVGRLWRMVEYSPALADEAPIRRFQHATHVRLRRSEVFSAWARGKSRLADKAIRIGHANEVDKWAQESTATEGDPLPRFLKRGAEFVDRKFIIESTPSIKGRSRVESGRLRSTNSKYQVPCPRCGVYQELVLGDGREPPGIFWQRAADGTHDPDVAQKTAVYVCGHCKSDLPDSVRHEMMNFGVWVPEGCRVRHERAIEARSRPGKAYLSGTPRRNGPDWGSQMSVLYGLFSSWGDIARDFVLKRKSPGDLRQFINEDLAQTWELQKRSQTWEELGERIIGDVPRWTVPSWASLVTIGVDRQADKLPWVADAWGPARRSHTLAYGELDEIPQLRELVERQFSHQDGGPSLRSAITLVDSGYRPEGVYEFCRDMARRSLQCWPTKGSSKPLDADFRQVRLGPQTSMPGMVLFHTDTYRTQGWIDRVLHQKTIDEAGATSLHRGSLGEHQDFLEQLLNDAAVVDVDSTNNARERWQRIDANVPNDFRDCRRYSYVAMLVATRGREVPPRGAQPKKRHAVVNAGTTRPDGRSWSG